MLTKLLFPPQWIPTQPYLSTPSLTAFLSSAECNVEQMDINITFFDDILTKESLKGYYEKSYEKFQELDSKTSLSPSLQKHYATLSTSMLFGNYIIDEIDNAKNILKDKNEFYNIDKLFKAFKILELGLKLVSSTYYPSNLTFHSYDMRYSCRSSKEVLLAIENREENLFIDYFEKKTIPEILKNRPDLIGISIINTSQLIPGLTLANLIKKIDKDIHINIGGSVFTRLINELSQNKELFSIFDSVIVHEGESALLSLVKHIENGDDIEKIPNLIYKKGNEIKVNALNSKGEELNSLPTPCFDGLPLDKYFSPHLVLPILSSRGCYWKRCTFCDHSYGYSGNYRPRDVDILYNDIETLKNKYNTKYITFQDEGISPKIISSLSDKIIENNLDISWLADSRFESSVTPQLCKKMSDSGCKMLYLGLESGNERILKCMDKGVKKDNVLKVCSSCIDSGIWTHLFLIFGFPTETQNEAIETMDFILNHHDIINSMSFGSFQLTKHSKVYENPSSFGVCNVAKNDNMDISLWYEHEVSKGMSKLETERTIAQFYNELSYIYKDFPIWSNLDREHLFLYISNYKKEGKTSDLSHLIEKVKYEASLKKKSSITSETKNSQIYPSLNEGVFLGAFNFNLAQIVHNIISGKLKDNINKEQTYVLFDTNDNRVFTITNFAKDIIEKVNENLDLSEIIEIISKKYQLSYNETETKTRSLLQGLIEKNIIYL